MAKQWACYWAGGNILKCRKRGYLRWVRGDRPKWAFEMQRMKFFVCQGNVGPTVESVVDAAPVIHQKEMNEWNKDYGWMVWLETANKWMKKGVEDWKKKAPEELGGYVDNLKPD